MAVVLDDLSGSFLAGHLSAIMGAGTRKLGVFGEVSVWDIVFLVEYLKFCFSLSTIYIYICICKTIIGLGFQHLSGSLMLV